MKEASYGCVVSPSTSPLGTIMRCAKTSCRLDDRCWPRQAPRSMSCCFLCRQLSELATICLISRPWRYKHSMDMPRVSERHATFNQIEMVRCRVWYESNVYLFLLLYERFLIFFICLLAGFALWFYLCYMWLQALKWLGYAWDFVEAMGQRTTAGIQYCVRFRQN